MVQGYNGNTAFKKDLTDLCDKVELSVRKYVCASSPSQPVGRGEHTSNGSFGQSDGRVD
jgi:hypothetical protein